MQINTKAYEKLLQTVLQHCESHFLFFFFSKDKKYNINLFHFNLYYKQFCSFQNGIATY